jgi:hypothetical protein
MGEDQALCRASTSKGEAISKTWMAGTSPAMTDAGKQALYFLVRQPDRHGSLIDRGSWLLFSLAARRRQMGRGRQYASCMIFMTGSFFRFWC